MAWIDEALDFALDAARGAGRILAEGFDRLETLGVDYKGRRDPVTEIDRASEEYLRSRVARERPGEGFLGEEGGGPSDQERYWIVDPLDGTVNFMHGHPVFNVSIALCVAGRIEVAVVNAPALGQVYHGARGSGAWRGGRRLSVSRTPSLAKSLLATGFPYDRTENARNNMDNFFRLSMEAIGIRRMGAAALDLAWVAAGIYDGFWELFLSPWDVAAGALLIEEAGGRVTDFAGGADWLFGRNILATNGLIHGEVAGKLDPVR